MPTLSIKLKIAASVALCLGLVVILNAAFARYGYRQEMRYAAEQSAHASARAFAAVQRREVERLSSTLDALLQNPDLAAAFAQRDRDRLREVAAPIFRELEKRHRIALWSFILPPPSRACFLRMHRPELFGEAVGRVSLQVAIRSGDSAAGLELGRTAFALRVVRPFVAQGRLLGYVELGEEIDGFLSRVREETGGEVALAIRKEFLDEKAWASARGARSAAWGDDPETVVVDATSKTAPIVGTSADLLQMADDGKFLERIDLGPLPFVRGLVPVRDAAGRQVGGLFVLHDVNALRDRVKGEHIRVIVLVGLLALTVLGLLLAMFEVLVFRRLQRMMSAMQDVSTRLAGGDYEVGGTLRPAAADEIGRFEAFLGSFLATIGATLRQLERRHRGAQPPGAPAAGPRLAARADTASQARGSATRR